MPPELDTEALETVLRRGPPLRLAVLFGSGARGSMRPDSDVDIGILPVDPDLPFGAEADLQVELELACGRTVDLVRLDQASTLLRNQVAREGRPLLEARDGACQRFRVAATLEYLDFLPTYDAAAERFRRSLIRLAKAPQ